MQTAVIRARKTAVCIQTAEVPGLAGGIRGTGELGHPDVTCWAALKLGDILARQRDDKKPQDIYELVIALRHPEFASLGALNLARLHRDRGERTAQVQPTNGLSLWGLPGQLGPPPKSLPLCSRRVQTASRPLRLD